MNKIQSIAALGQSIWYDNISRAMIRGGELRQRVEEGLGGVTSNPTIFDKAISGSHDYEQQIAEIRRKNPAIDASALIQELMITDIQEAADVLLPVFTRTGGGDGFVSVEVSPGKARDTEATMAEVRDLWKRINRKNLMVKIPATKEGLPAIQEMISEGININITLIFGLDRYKEVAYAYLAGIEKRLGEGKAVDHIASVASVFVSRVDTMVDDLLQKQIAGQSDKKKSEQLHRLQGKVAVANAKMIYQAFREVFESARFTALASRGARLQRPLWGSTGTKNPSYSDVLYVETLIGRDTVNTVPPQTYKAILDHAHPALTVENGLEEARSILAGLRDAGIMLKDVTDKLEAEGVASFEKSFDGLYRFLSEDAHKK